MKKTNKKYYLALITILSFVLVTCVENHLLPNFGTVFVSSDPIGAEIFLNDSAVGVTPDSLVELLSGDYTLKLKKSGFVDSSFSFQLNDNQNLQFDVFLKEVNPKGKIILTSDPSGASIFINGENTDKFTPATFLNLERGKYSVQLKLNLYENMNFDVNLSKDETIQKNTKMIIAGTSGSLFITSTPIGAKIYLDDFNTGQITPDTLKPLASGNYKVNLSLDNYQDTTFFATVVSGATTNKNISLKRLYSIEASVKPTNSGSVSGIGLFLQGYEARLVAVPSAGYSFVNWTENNLIVATDSIYIFTVNANRNLIANMSLNSYVISTSSNPLAGGTTSGAGSFHYGDNVSLTATPEIGYSFLNWTENGTVVSTDQNYSFSVNKSRSLVANFSLNNYIITTSSNPTTGGSTSGGGGFDFNDIVNLTATPFIGYTFVNWTENGNVVSIDQNYTFNVNGSRSLVANFSLNSYTISSSSNPSNAGTTNGDGIYSHGQTVNLSSTPNFGYSFVNWTENGSEVSTNTFYTFIAESDRNLIANFVENGRISIDSDPVGASIYVDNISSGLKTPNTLENILAGSYNITLKLRDFADTTIFAEVFSGQTSDLGSIYLRDTTSSVSVKISYEVNTGQQLVFTFVFNQDIRFDRVDVTTPLGTSIPQSYGGQLVPKGVGLTWNYPEKLTGNWSFTFRGEKVGGRKDSFVVDESINVN